MHMYFLHTYTHTQTRTSPKHKGEIVSASGKLSVKYLCGFPSEAQRQMNFRQPSGQRRQYLHGLATISDGRAT